MYQGRALRLTVLTVFLGLSHAAHVAVAADEPPVVAESDIQVERSGDHFIVDLTMHAPVPPARAWAVLTDFEHMASFVPNLTSSQITERGENKLKITQTGVARYGVFSSKYESVREIYLSPPNEIRAHGVGGNVSHLESVMRLEADGTGTKLTYHAEAAPDFWFPPVIGPALVRHETAEQFNAMLREMLKQP